MRAIIVALLAGLILGLALAPSEASDDRLKRRIQRLEAEVDDLRNEVRTFNTATASAIDQLQNQAQRLTTSGTYLGDVDPNQIRKPLHCLYGDPAVWEFHLDCYPGGGSGPGRSVYRATPFEPSSASIFAVASLTAALSLRTGLPATGERGAA